MEKETGQYGRVTIEQVEERVTGHVTDEGENKKNGNKKQVCGGRTGLDWTGLGWVGVMGWNWM